MSATRTVTTTALIYTRVSSDEQAREGVSLDAQLAEARRYAAARGWSLGQEYQDVMTGKRDDRPQYLAMLDEVRRLSGEGRRAVVVVAALDRLGRRLKEQVDRREEMKTLGVSVHSVRDGGEVLDFIANVLASLAQEEVRRLGERISASRKHIANAGWRPVGRCPWGFLWRPATDDERRQGAPKSVLDVDPDTAPYVRQAFQMVADGHTIRSTMRWITSLPESTRKGQTRGYGAIQRMLNMPVYVGRSESPSDHDVLSRAPQQWPALIDDATWAAVHRRLSGHTWMPHQAKGHYLLTGLIRCPVQGAHVRLEDRQPVATLPL